MKRENLDLAAVRARLAQARGPVYWRGIEELAETQALQEFMRHEFPEHASAGLEAVSRRDFLRLMGASLALAGLGGCGSPAPSDEKIVPYVRQPEKMVPGKPLFFATAFALGGVATGILVESHEGRPTKIEGNPDHPASLGATDALTQASILALYDPDRSQVVTNAGVISTWSAFFAALNGALEEQRLKRGAGLRILTETVTSPTLSAQLRDLLAKFPTAKWHQYEPVNRDCARAGARLAFGQHVETLYRFDRADRVLSLDADFLFTGPGSVRHARDFVERRRVEKARAEMNRLYVVESVPSVTGAMADHRLALAPSEFLSFARALASRVGVPAGKAAQAAPSTRHQQWIDAAAQDLRRHRGSAIMIAGEAQPPAIHALAHAMNHALDNVGKTVAYTEPVEANPIDQTASLRDLARDMASGRVSVLIILGGNPVFTAPADVRFAECLSAVKFRVHLSLYEDETSELCHWHIPEAHFLEAWSDTRAYDGTVTITQPLIAPLYGGKSAHELVAALLDQPSRTGYEIVRAHWQSRIRSKDFEFFWRRALHDGLIAGTALAPKPVKLNTSAIAQLGETEHSQPQSALEIIFRPDPTIYDGRFANNGWLQELPKPLTKLTWDNAVLVSPATAQRLGLGHRIGTTGGEHGRIFADMVELRYGGRMARAPVWITPGHADGCATVYFGYGRTRAGRVGSGTGFNMYAIRTSAAPWHGAGLEVRKIGEPYMLACTQFHHQMEGRDLLRAGTIDQYRKNPNFAQEPGDRGKTPATLYPPFPYEGHAWGMTIDLNACIGCNACVVACQAENNIAVVGKSEVTRGREMHWLRIDRYYKGDLDHPKTYHQPVPCMQCENASCELVCPVGATNHSSEGLNDMVYNRCVGTRYCSNNCPYKVRRFNFFQYADFETPSLKLLRNPNVTVRSRGVMEKCTYCVQRIQAAKIAAEKQDRQVRDGEIVTACQAACPTQAIVFGDLNDRLSRVSALKAEPRHYTLLAELNTKPRTSYLAKLKNPNPEIEKG